MLLPSADIGLITNHLLAHDGLIRKIKMHITKVESSALKNVLNKKLSVLRNHVKLMLEMLNPDKSDFTDVPDLSELPPGSKAFQKIENASELDKHIALETKTAAESMALDNFFSALKMKDPKVKAAHEKFALQEVELLKEITEILKEMDAEIIPVSSVKEQQKVMKHFEHILSE